MKDILLGIKTKLKDIYESIKKIINNLMLKFNRPYYIVDDTNNIDDYNKSINEINQQENINDIRVKRVISNNEMPKVEIQKAQKIGLVAQKLRTVEQEQKQAQAAQEQQPVIKEEQQPVIKEEQQPAIKEEQQPVIKEEQQPVIKKEQQPVLKEEQKPEQKKESEETKIENIVPQANNEEELTKEQTQQENQVQGHEEEKNLKEEEEQKIKRLQETKLENENKEPISSKVEDIEDKTNQNKNDETNPLSETEKRYINYKKIMKILGEEPKESLEILLEYGFDKNIYEYTSNDKKTRGLAAYKIGKILCKVSDKNEAGRKFLKNSIKILKECEKEKNDQECMDYIEFAYLNLAKSYSFYDMHNEAEESMKKYLEELCYDKEKYYDPQIDEAKKENAQSSDIDLIKSKFALKKANGAKTGIYVLSREGKEDLAKEQYENLLKKYNFGVDDIDYQQARNCIENCLYIKPKNDRVSGVYTIIGNESYIAKRNREDRKKIDEINKKYAKHSEEVKEL